MNNTSPSRWHRSGKAGIALILWLVGVPIPLVLLYLLISSCSG